MAAVSSSRGMQFVFYVLVWKQDVYLWQICRVYVSHVQYRMCWHFVKVKLRTVKGQIVNVFFMLNNMLYCLFSMKIDYFMLFCTVLNASLVAPVSTKCQKKSRMPCVRYSAWRELQWELSTLDMRRGDEALCLLSTEQQRNLKIHHTLKSDR